MIFQLVICYVTAHGYNEQMVNGSCYRQFNLLYVQSKVNGQKPVHVDEKTRARTYINMHVCKKLEGRRGTGRS